MNQQSDRCLCPCDCYNRKRVESDIWGRRTMRRLCHECYMTNCEYYSDENMIARGQMPRKMPEFTLGDRDAKLYEGAL